MIAMFHDKPVYGIYRTDVKGVKIYGVTWDGSATSRWARTGASSDFSEPVPIAGGVTGYGSPFDNLMPWAGMVEVERAGGTMVAIPKFWYSIKQNTPGDIHSGLTIEIANAPIPGFYVSPAHIDRGDGKGERDIVYVGSYSCNTSFKSVKESTPVTNLTRATARESIHAIDPALYQIDFLTKFTIQLLYLVEFSDWNSQEKIGYGCSSANDKSPTGNGAPILYHTGTSAARDAYSNNVMYRNIHDIWSNVINWLDGCYNTADGFHIILNPDNFSDTANGILLDTPMFGYPSAFSVNDAAGFPIFFPAEIKGGTAEGMCDKWNISGGSSSLIGDYPVYYMGGSYATKSGVFGMFYQHAVEADRASNPVGCRAIELP